MGQSDYFSFLTELPHLVLILFIGFLSILIFIPFLLSIVFPPSNGLNFILLFTYYWKNVLISWSGINPIFCTFLIVIFSFFVGFIFVGLYDFIEYKIIDSIAKYFDLLLRKSFKNYRERKKYYDIFKKGIEGDNVGQYNIGTEKYAKIQFEMYKSENRHLRSYYNWEFIKDASCSYLAFLIFVFWIILLFYLLNYYLGLAVSISQNIDIPFHTIVFIIFVSVLGFLSLEYGHLFYGSARIQARLEAYKILDK